MYGHHSALFRLIIWSCYKNLVWFLVMRRTTLISIQVLIIIVTHLNTSAQMSIYINIHFESLSSVYNKVFTRVADSFFLCHL